MNILHMIPNFPINKNHTVVGGAANALFNLVNQQKLVGDHIEILSNYPLLSGKDRNYFKDNNFIDLDIKAAQNSKMFGIEFTLKTSTYALLAHEQREIIHGHSGHIDYLLSGQIFSKISHNNLIYSLYCPLNLNSLVTEYPLRKRILELISRSVNFIATSRNIADSLKQINFDMNVVFIPPAIDVNRYTDIFNKAELRIRNLFDVNQPIILFVGNFSKTKNMECVLIAFSKFIKHCPSAKLIITTELKINKFSERVIYIKRLICELNISEGIIFKGVIDNMPELMQLSDVLVAPFLDTDGPSDYYLAALEAMSVGTPVFVSPVGGMKEVIDGSNGKFIDPDQPDQLASELINYFADPSIGIQMGINAAKFSRLNFTPVLIEKQVKDVYSEALNGKN